MRKATVIFILVAFIASIMIVNFFGLKIKVYNQYVYVDNIEVTKESIKCSPGLKVTDFVIDDKNVINIYVSYEIGYKERTGKDQVLMIIPHCYPDDADDKTVKCINEGNSKEFYVVEEGVPVPTITYNFTQEKVDKLLSKSTPKETITVYLANEMAGDKVKRKVKITTTLVDLIEG